MKIKALRDDVDLKNIVKYAYNNDACIDLVCCKHTWIPAYTNRIIPSGIAIEFPAGTFGLVLPRSGLAAAHRISILGGVIDNGYRGEIMVNIMNHGNTPVALGLGERMAQLGVLNYFRAKLEWLEDYEHFTSTDRGDAGHGSTGR